MADTVSIITTIKNATYGKEMRPAIAEGLLDCWATNINITVAIDKLSKRLDALSGGDSGGGGDAPSYYDNLEPPILFVKGGATSLNIVGTPIG